MTEFMRVEKILTALFLGQLLCAGSAWAAEGTLLNSGAVSVVNDSDRGKTGTDSQFSQSARILQRLAAERPTLQRPMRLGMLKEFSLSASPVFTKKGLVPSVSLADFRGLGRHAGDVVKSVVYDPSSDAWFAWSNGMIVEVKEDGTLPVVIQDPPGHDFDIRAAQGWAVFRDPDKNEIVLQSLRANDDGSVPRRVLHSGIEYFNPRFSPDASKIVVGMESSGREGRLIVTDLKSGKSSDIGIGCQPVWSPDGNTLYFMDFENDSYNITASKLYARELKREATARLFESREILMTSPSIAPDGRSIAFVDEKNWDVSVAELPATEINAVGASGEVK